MKLKHLLPLLQLLALIMLCGKESNAQEASSSEPDSIAHVEATPRPQRRASIIPLPVAGTNPTTGFVLGFAPGVTWQLGNKETTSMSALVGSAVYTTNRQLIFSLRGTSFFPDDKWVLMADLRFRIASQPTYGLGTGTPSDYVMADGGGKLDEREYLSGHQMMEYRYIRVYLTGLKRYRDTRFFGGLGYHLDAIYDINDHRLNLDAVPPQITNHYRYNTLKGFSTEGNTVAGVSLNGLYDSRDNIANPYSGMYLLATYRINTRFMGSPKPSSTLWLESRQYFSLSQNRPRHMIAWWAYGWFVTSGSMPYMNLPAIGWDMFSRSGRGYTIGRFRGEDMAYTELEYRFPLQQHKETLGAVIFTNLVTASSRTENVSMFQYVNLAYGVGLRVMLKKNSRSNIAIDYGRGLNGSSGFFLALNEAF